MSFKAFDSFILIHLALAACVQISMSSVNWGSLTSSELMSGILFTYIMKRRGLRTEP